LKNFLPGETTGPLRKKGGGGGKVLKVPTFTGRGGEGRIRKRGDRGWGNIGEEKWLGELLQGLRGIDAPVCSPYTVHSMD